MLRRSTVAIDHLSPNLEFVVLQIGGIIYGAHLLHGRPKDIMSVPLSEAHPRLQCPPENPLFYHSQIDWITKYAQHKKWSWCETRPDLIIGFVPTQNYYSIATSLGIFLELFAATEGRGTTCAFPGSE